MTIRRHFLRVASLLTAGLPAQSCAQKSWGQPALGGDAAPSKAEHFERRAAQIEAASGGRLGIVVLDTETGARYGHRGDERFPLCSTFKALAAALVLARVDLGLERLDRRVQVPVAGLLSNSPATKRHAGGAPMTMAQLCEAAVTLSDNTAANLLLRSFGGPAALTAYARSLGDTTTRLDRRELALNTAIAGDPRDTSSPAAMLADLRALATGPALSRASREQLVAWLVANKTGGARLRAGLPPGWRVGDKTGSGDNGTTNDLAVLWPPGRAPVFVACYLTGSTVDADARNQALADVGRLTASLVAA
jgi:beta-lactamase class A